MVSLASMASYDPNDSGAPKWAAMRRDFFSSRDATAIRLALLAWDMAGRTCSSPILAVERTPNLSIFTFIAGYWAASGRTGYHQNPPSSLVSQDAIMRYTPESLMRLANSVLAVLGCNEEESQIVADHLVQANLTGHDSHGIGMLPTYALQVFDGNMVPNQTPTLAPPVGAISVVDAHLGFGHRMALLGLDHAMQSIDEHRVAILALLRILCKARIRFNSFC